MPDSTSDRAHRLTLPDGGPRTASAEPACPACGSALQQPLLHGQDRLIGVEGEFTVAECPRCGLAATFPRLQGDVLARHYPDTYGPFRPPRGISSRLITALRRRRANADLRKSPFRDLTRRATGRVLDVGCGRGDLAAAFVRRGWRADGLEPSASAVAAARHQGVDAREGTLDTAADDLRDYDLVVFNHSLEHVPDPIAALREARSRLRPGGVVVVAVPDWSSWQRRAFGSRWFHLDLPRHLQHFSPRSLRSAMSRAGLEPEPEQPRSRTSLVGLLGSIQYALCGRCVFAGPRLRPALVVASALYPLTLLIGAVLGGDTLVGVGTTGTEGES